MSVTLVESPLNLPLWLDTLVITLLTLGFPLVLILAWIREPAVAGDVVRRADVRDLAPQVTVPTLVIHSRNEPGVPVECSREAAALIPGARFFALDSRNHIVLEREPAYRQFIDEIVAFTKAAQAESATRIDPLAPHSEVGRSANETPVTR